MKITRIQLHDTLALDWHRMQWP